jgi:hypothetical protein
MTFLFQIVMRYLKTVHPLRMLWHLVWIFCVLSMLSTTYIITFHFQPVMDLWMKSESMNSFAKELQTSVAVDTQTKEELNKLLAVTNASRVYVFRYHNGTPSPNNVPFIFFTNTHEIIKPGANRVIDLNQRIPASLIHDMNIEFVKDKCVMLNDINKNPNSANYWLFQTRNSIATIRCPFFSSKGDLIGFVGIDFTESTQDSALQSSGKKVHESAKNLTKIFDR